MSKRVETVVLTSAEIAASDPHIGSLELVYNRTTGELRAGPGTWDECTPVQAPAKVFRATLTQTGTAAPVVKVGTTAVNTLGGAVVIERSSAGQYTVTGTGLFTLGKTRCVAQLKVKKVSGEIIASADATDADTVTIDVRDESFVWTDGWELDLLILVDY